MVTYGTSVRKDFFTNAGYKRKNNLVGQYNSRTNGAFFLVIFNLVYRSHNVVDVGDKKAAEIAAELT